MNDLAGLGQDVGVSSPITTLVPSEGLSVGDYDVMSDPMIEFSV